MARSTCYQSPSPTVRPRGTWLEAHGPKLMVYGTWPKAPRGLSEGHTSIRAATVEREMQRREQGV
eukprot:4359679-Prymnesium_polylepis.1